MTILIKNARIIDPTSPHHGQQKDILLDGGIIGSIANDIDPIGADEIIEGDDICVSTGWIDLFATFGDPGAEHRESIVTGLDAAANGGFTRVAISPESQPVADGKGGVEYILKQAAHHLVNALPLAAMSKRIEGKELAEMYDMVNTGAAGISNAKHTVADTKVMQVAMQYAQELQVPFYCFCEDARLAHGGQMHEGNVSTMLGLRGIPALAEELAVIRDLHLARYTGAALHFSHVTTAGAVSLIRAAKAEGLPVTASVPVHHLALTDDAVSDFDSNYKLSPPLRDMSHVDALWQGLSDGTIDTIISDHEPLEVEAKFMEFGQARTGVTALETLFPLLLKAAEGRAPLELLISKLTEGPKKVLRIELVGIEEGAPAELTIFSPNVQWVYNEDTAASLSRNSPLWNAQLTGRSIAVINGDQMILSSF